MAPPFQPPRTAPPPPAPKKPKGWWRSGFAAAVPWLFILTLGVIIMQIGLGAVVALADRDYLGAHGMMAGILHLLPLLIILVSALGKDYRATIAGGAMLVLVFIQFPLIASEGIVRALHVLNALLIFTIALVMMRERIPWATQKPTTA